MITDARGHTLTLNAPPERIVSLVPSQTELLAYLGLDEQVVGLTRFCVHPDGWKARKPIVGGTKQVDLDRIRALEPDLILANHEENTKAMVEALDAVAPVYVTSVTSIPDACAMIRTVGHLTHRSDIANALVADVQQGFDVLDEAAPLRIAYLIWRDPYMTVGHDTFIHAVCAQGGFVNAFADQMRYPEVTPVDLAAADLDALLLSSEPFPFQPAHIDEFRPHLPETPIHIVDGELFSWYGPRLLHTPAYLDQVRTEVLAQATSA